MQIVYHSTELAYRRNKFVRVSFYETQCRLNTPQRTVHPSAFRFPKLKIIYHTLEFTSNGVLFFNNIELPSTNFFHHT